MKVVSFFAGAGGFDKGFIEADYDVVAAYEWDKFAVESYRANIGDHIKQQDVSLLTGEDIPNANVWLFGFPCQDVSVQGRRAGMESGTRTGLFYEIMRLLGEVSEGPEVIVAENVKGLKKFLPTVEEEFKKAGYNFYVTSYNTKNFGLPQNRERYFMVGIRSDFKKEFKFETHVGRKVRLLPLLDHFVDPAFYYPDKEQDLQHMVDKFYENMYEAGELVELGHLKSLKGYDSSKRVYSPLGIAPTLTACGGGNTQAKVLIKERGVFKARRVTPMEYSRLQGFTNFKQVVSNVQLYKQMGNAVSVPVAKSVAEQIREYMTSL